jgi:type II restriction enzyme
MTGNKDEWSEVYVLLKLLAEGKLNAADANLNAIPTVYYPILKIIRQEKSINREYIINGNIKIIDSTANKEILNLPVLEFVNRSNYLFNELKKIKGSSFSFPDIEEFLHSININSLKALKTDKSDIILVVHDLNTGLKPQLGFNIKSLLEKDVALFNPGNTANFIYEITGKNKLNIKDINSIKSSPFITNRINEIYNKKFKIKFYKIQSDTLQLNLQLIDSDLPKILSELLLIKYSTTGNSSLSTALKLIKEKNPLNFDLSKGHPFYEYKIKKYLTASALGMTPSSIWTGKYGATEGIIIVKEDGDLVCYHIYNRNEFQDYLLNNTRFEQASTSRYNFGSLYEENGKIYLKLNLQIRFN